MDKKQEEKVRGIIDNLDAIKGINPLNCEGCKRVVKRVGKDNPETYLAQAFMIMAQQSIEPKLYQKLLKIYDLLCDNRKLHKFDF